MRGLVCILLLGLSALLGAIASLWMAPAAPVVRLAIWLSDRAKAIDKLNHATDHIAGFIRDICFIESDRPDLIIYEAAMAPFEDNNSDDDNGGRKRTIRRSVESITLPIMATASVRAIARCYGIQRELAWPATWRKHFLGRGNFGDREETKRQTLLRCRLLKFPELAWRDDNAADACGIFSYASATFGRAAPRDLHLFGEGRA